MDYEDFSIRRLTVTPLEMTILLTIQLVMCLKDFENSFKNLYSNIKLVKCFLNKECLPTQVYTKHIQVFSLIAEILITHFHLDLPSIIIPGGKASIN